MKYRHLFTAVDGQVGLLTSSWSKPQMLARLSEALRAASHLFFSRRLLAECRSFVRMANGGLGARNGAHDDRVMALALALEARAQMLGGRGRDRDQGTRDQGTQERGTVLGGGRDQMQGLNPDS